jgi:phage terminase large subunit-like protein
MALIKQEIDQWLDTVNYTVLNSPNYMPTEFSLIFMNWIKLVNGGTGESHKTPPVHLAMLDKVAQGVSDYIANLCFRGAAKTTLFMEYLTLFVAHMGYLPNFGRVEGMIYVSDSMDNGVKSARKNIEFRYNNSEFLQYWVPSAKFTDNYLEFKNRDGMQLGVKMFGAKALSLDTALYLANGSVTTIGSCEVGQKILGADGLPTTITQKSEVFNKPMYKLELDDGRELKVSEDHWNQVWVKEFKSDKTFSSHTLTEATLSTLELLEQPLFAEDPNGSKRPLLWVQNIEPMQFPENTSLLLDPYTVGLLLGDGSMNCKSSGNVPVVLTAHKDDWETYCEEVPYELGKAYVDKRNTNVVCRTIIGINRFVSAHGLSVHGNDKRIPEDFLLGSAAQRLALLQGLMDTDGSCSKDGKSSFSSNSKLLVEGVMWLVRSLGGEARWVSTGKDNHYRTLVRTLQPLFRLPRKLVRQLPFKNDKAAIVSITRAADEPSQCIAVDNEQRQFVAGEGLVRTHNTGLRGTKIFGKRPVLCILDDLVSDDDSKSKVAMESIKDTVYKGVNHALDPTRRKVIFNGTPFNKDDILIEAVESGAWDVNVWPVCERFPCTKEEFVGAWEDRFSFEYVSGQYDMAVKTGKESGFFQELMLRITSEEERLVQEGEIRWYERAKLLAKKSTFNFYITTDFATSAKQSADFSVISVWAYNSNGDWFWVDGVCERQTMEKTLADLFRLVQIYKPQSVGIETSGQQGAFIKWIQGEMLNKNIYFNLASSRKSGEPGIQSQGDKLTRFTLVLPWFKLGKFYFPEEMKRSVIMGIFMGQLRLVTKTGIKGKDDCIDTISQLSYLTPWKPSESAPVTPDENSLWEEHREVEALSGLASYIV